MNREYIEFTGEETEKEFLEKCLQQWDSASEETQPVLGMLQLGSLFSEMRHRVNELKEGEDE